MGFLPYKGKNLDSYTTNFLSTLCADRRQKIMDYIPDIFANKYFVDFVCRLNEKIYGLLDDIFADARICYCILRIRIVFVVPSILTGLF